MQPHDTTSGTSIKVCNQCGETKPLSEFYRATLNKDGLRNDCKYCANIRHSTWAAEHKDQLNERKRAYRAAHSEETKEAQRNWRKAHLDKALARAKAWRQTPKGKEAASKRRATDEYKEYRAEYDKSRRSRSEVKERLKESNAAYQRTEEGRAAHLRAIHKYRVPTAIMSTLTAQEWEKIKADYGNVCAYCEGVGKAVEMDHFIPLTLGGNHMKENVVPACRSCNVLKSNHLWLTARQIRQLITGT